MYARGEMSSPTVLLEDSKQYGGIRIEVLQVPVLPIIAKYLNITLGIKFIVRVVSGHIPYTSVPIGLSIVPS